MQSPYKRIVVYDLETGGLSHKHNSITEMAAVVIDLENLEIIEEFSTMIKPRIDLSYRELDPLKEAKAVFNMLKTKDAESNMNTLGYRGVQITLKNLEPLVEDISTFYDYIDEVGDVFEYEDILKLEAREDLGDIVRLYFNKTYNPQALEVTHISRDMIVSEGVSQLEAFEEFSKLLVRHTIANSKPILAGHNIKKFDNPFMERFFNSNEKDLYKYISDTQMIDTLEWARLRWFELSGYNLGICANEVGLTLKEAHRALPDTVANAKFLIKLLKGLRGEGSQASTYKKRKFSFNF